jgi:hypothetical protein
MMLAWFRRQIYRRGYRPKPGSIFYSPSLAYIHSHLDYARDPDVEVTCMTCALGYCNPQRPLISTACHCCERRHKN